MADDPATDALPLSSAEHGGRALSVQSEGSYGAPKGRAGGMEEEEGQSEGGGFGVMGAVSTVLGGAWRLLTGPEVVEEDEEDGDGF